MSGKWVYIRTENQLWTVGFYDPSGKFQPDSDWDNRDEARERVHYLNGGQPEQDIREKWAADPISRHHPDCGCNRCVFGEDKALWAFHPSEY